MNSNIYIYICLSLGKIGTIGQFVQTIPHLGFFVLSNQVGRTSSTNQNCWAQIKDLVRPKTNVIVYEIISPKPHNIWVIVYL